jgi:hypothetical protein
LIAFIAVAIEIVGYTPIQKISLQFQIFRNNEKVVVEKSAGKTVSTKL